MRTHTSPSEPAQPWSRARLQGALIGAVAIAVVLVAGVAILIASSLRPTLIVDGGAPPGGGLGAPPSAHSRDDIAAAPMPSLDPGAATRPDPALSPAPAIHLPNAVEGRGPAGVPVYGHSPDGAVAQLAAIDVAVLEAMDVAYTAETYQAWVTAGGPALEEWDLAVNVAGFLRGARQGSVKDAATIVTVAPAGGMVKGSDGPDWVVACVLLDVRATIAADYRMGWGHCARMQWTDGRWQIARGTPPATAPSAWPGSKAAVAAGWLTWSSAEQEALR
ncbi:MAG: hypothetical protein QM779_15350 [Propionicimonas sp.]|uniref:hypothetical protein n=1 Tax=Propionicimonas sp. TaxID=1955623 RepID=UPI003D0EF996